MKKKQTIRLAALLILLTAAGLPQAPAQRHNYTADSAAFVDAEWHTDSLDGFLYRHHHFMHRQVFNSNQYFCIVEIPKGTGAHLAFVADTHLTKVSDFAIRSHALAAINGSYFNMQSGEPICYLRINGKEWGQNTPGRTDTVNRKYYQYATLRLLRNGKPRLLVPDSIRNAETALRDSNVMTAGPMLLYQGTEVKQKLNRRFVTDRHNRTALGIKPDGTVLLVVADGRAKREAEGLSLPELAKVMQWLGCRDAVNLDGGGSSTMYVKDKGLDGIVNHPSDNGCFDPQGQRPVSNAIVVVK